MAIKDARTSESAHDRPGPDREAGAAGPRSGARRLLPFLVIAAVIAGFLWYIGVFGGNVHAIVPGVAYRSAQLTGRNLDSVLQTDHIATVINLRGGKSRDGFYRSELASCAQHDARHIDIALNGSKLPTPDQIDRLVGAMDTARYPILIHCQAGADRTGLASTLYLVIERGVPLDKAESEELTWRYGHFSFGATHAMNVFFDLFRETHGSLTMREWIAEDYPRIYAQAPANLHNRDAELKEYVFDGHAAN